MTLPDVPHETGTLEQARSRAIERQLAIERGMVRSIIRGIVIALPLSIAVLIGMLALAISDEQPWYVWVGLGAGIGIYVAVFFGVIGGVMMATHRLDQADNAETGHPT